MSNDTSHKDGMNKQRPHGALSRREMLLTGTSALAAAGVVSAAQAQQQTPAATGGRKPNILVHWGDDVVRNIVVDAADAALRKRARAACNGLLALTG